jgi:hypothetical protein
MLVEVDCLAARKLGGDTQLFSGRARDADGVLRTFLGREAPEKVVAILVRRTGETAPKAARAGSCCCGIDHLLSPGRCFGFGSNLRPELACADEQKSTPRRRHSRREGHTEPTKERKVQPVVDHVEVVRFAKRYGNRGRQRFRQVGYSGSALRHLKASTTSGRSTTNGRALGRNFS